VPSGSRLRSVCARCYSVVGADAQRAASAAEEDSAQLDVIEQVDVDGGLRQATACSHHVSRISVELYRQQPSSKHCRCSNAGPATVTTALILAAAA